MQARAQPLLDQASPFVLLLVQARAQPLLDHFALLLKRCLSLFGPAPRAQARQSARCLAWPTLDLAPAGARARWGLFALPLLVLLVPSQLLRCPLPRQFR